MKTPIKKVSEIKENITQAWLFDRPDQLPENFLSNRENEYLNKKLKKTQEVIIYRYPQILFFYKIKTTENASAVKEKIREAGASFLKLLKNEKITSAQLVNISSQSGALPFAEGMLLSAYSFSKYKKEKDEYTLKELFVLDKTTDEKNLQELQHLTHAVCWARDLVNEPLSTLTATKLSEEISIAGEEAGFSVEVFGKQKIKALKMGGLLAVNKGSIDPPTFSILEWKPANKKNTKPVVLVGKGVVYDTGGLSLKPTPNSMDYMKSDMGGAAAIAATILALAKAKIPVHVIGLVPATDNRPDGNAYAPGDIITMHDGTTVEIKNTDAEGRLLLADALSYAKKYDPELVIDVATLTGTAVLITGHAGSPVMGNSPDYLASLKEAGEETWERLVELPLWEDFAEPLKSAVADMNNLGTREGQASIAGKFLEHFTDYPWIHIDIAGPAFIGEEKAYRTKGGTGTGTRLLYHFIKNNDFNGE